MFVSRESKIKFIDFLELLCKKSGISDYSLGVMIRSYHFGMPCAFMFVVLLCNEFLAYIAVVYYSFILTSYIIFQGCFVSMLENRLCNDKFNIVDPFLEINGDDVNYKNRKIVTTYIAFCYTLLFYGIYYFRFHFKLPINASLVA
tara:strand:+ start:1631 stop:2065 length:435 start_codon:yes stop_codon:yes gene_type:complete